MLFTFGVNNVMNIPQHIEGSYCLYPFAEQNGARDIAGSEPLDDVVLESTFTANRLQDFSAWNKLPSGNYRLKLSVRDSLGREENNGAYGSDSFMLFQRVTSVRLRLQISFIIKKMRNLMYSTLPLFFWGLLIGMHMC